MPDKPNAQDLSDHAGRLEAIRAQRGLKIGDKVNIKNPRTGDDEQHTIDKELAGQIGVLAQCWDVAILS